MSWLSYSILFIVIVVIYLLIHKLLKKQQLAFIKSYSFHQSIRKKINVRYPQLNAEQTHLVFRALRDYFWMCNTGKRKMVAMPSQLVDVAWYYPAPKDAAAEIKDHVAFWKGVVITE